MPERSPSSKQHWYITNRRRHTRLEKQVPIKIIGPVERGESFTEMTQTVDFSATGVRLLLESPVEVGERILISANEPELKAHLAAFEIRWTVPMEQTFLVGAELDMPSYKWQLETGN